MEFNTKDAMTIMLDDILPEYPRFDPAYRRAPRREAALTQADKELAIRNALRYIPKQHHAQMAVEFAQELEQTGRIYGYRFRPEGKLIGKQIRMISGIVYAVYHGIFKRNSSSRLIKIFSAGCKQHINIIPVINRHNLRSGFIIRCVQ